MTCNGRNEEEEEEEEGKKKTDCFSHSERNILPEIEACAEAGKLRGRVVFISPSAPKLPRL